MYSKILSILAVVSCDLLPPNIGYNFRPYLMQFAPLSTKKFQALLNSHHYQINIRLHE